VALLVDQNSWKAHSRAMSLIPIPPEIPGIRGLLHAYPETAGPLMALAQVLLRGPSTLAEGERELLAVAVSVENRCAFCSKSHAAAARVLLGPQASWVDAVLSGSPPLDLPERLSALLVLARSVARSGHETDAKAAAQARAAGASDRELHDTVLIAAAFSLFNRYVDGLGAFEPEEAGYAAMGERLARFGYH